MGQPLEFDMMQPPDNKPSALNEAASKETPTNEVSREAGQTKPATSALEQTVLEKRDDPEKEEPKKEEPKKEEPKKEEVEKENEKENNKENKQQVKKEVKKEGLKNPVGQ